MANRLPLVLGADGAPQQLQPADTLSLGGWTAYTPSVAAASGAITATATGRFCKTGTLVHFEVNAAITSLGTGSGLVIGLPFPAAAYRYTVPGEIIGGNMVRGSIAASASTFTVTTYSTASPLIIGTIVLTGIYESAS